MQLSGHVIGLLKGYLADQVEQARGLSPFRAARGDCPRPRWPCA